MPSYPAGTASIRGGCRAVSSSLPPGTSTSTARIAHLATNLPMESLKALILVHAARLLWNSTSHVGTASLDSCCQINFIGAPWLKEGPLVRDDQCLQCKGTAALGRSFCHRARKSPKPSGYRTSTALRSKSTPPSILPTQALYVYYSLLSTLYHQLPSCTVRSAIIGIKCSIWRRGAGLVTRPHPIQSQIAPPQVPSSTEDREATNMGWLTHKLQLDHDGKNRNRKCTKWD
ncbi:hypothetical protein V8C34DRAFT_49921 [Trichoderma compactum]